MEIQNEKTDNKTTLKTLKLEQKLYLEKKSQKKYPNAV